MAEPERLPLRADDLPEITDAGVGLTLLMVSSVLADRERQALFLQLAASIETGDRVANAELCRRLAAVPPAVGRMADVARAGLDRYDAGEADPTVDPATNARSRRSLVKAVNWLDRRFWPMYGTVRPVMPPASDTAPPPRQTSPGPALTCGEMMTDRLARYDRELLRMATDPRPSALTARRIMVSDRNAQSASCRDCADCPVSRDALTEPLPLP